MRKQQFKYRRQCAGIKYQTTSDVSCLCYKTKRWSWKKMCFTGLLGLFYSLPTRFHFLCLSNFAASTTCTFIPHKPLKASLIVVQPQLIQSAPNLQLLCSSSMLNGGTSVLLICIMSTSSGLLLIPIISAYWWCAARGVPCPKPAGRGPREQRKWGGIDGRFLHRSLCSQGSWQQLPGALCRTLRGRDKHLGETETVGDSCCSVAPQVKVAAVAVQL